MEWLYNAKKITKLPEEVIGFIYIIYYTDGKMYVGKKLAVGDRKKWLTQKQQEALPDKRMSKFTRIKVEHKWRDYTGSSKLCEGKTIKSKHILHLCTDKRSMTYLEVKELMIREALETDAYLNNNINGNWFDNCIDGLYNGTVPEHCLFGGEYE